MSHAFICVLRSGGVYTPDWVHRLRTNLVNVYPEDFRFVVFTDIPDIFPDCRVRLMSPNKFPGWWAKLQIFRYMGGSATYIDLDTMILKDPTPLIVNHGIRVMEDALFPGHVNSSVISWEGDYEYLLDEYLRNPEKYRELYVGKNRPGNLLAEQGYIENTLDKKPEFFSHREVASYKKHCRNGPGEAIAVTFHGRPKPAEAGGWASEEWKRYLP